MNEPQQNNNVYTEQDVEYCMIAHTALPAAIVGAMTGKVSGTVIGGVVGYIAGSLRCPDVGDPRPVDSQKLGELSTPLSNKYAAKPATEIHQKTS